MTFDNIIQSVQIVSGAESKLKMFIDAYQKNLTHPKLSAGCLILNSTIEVDNQRGGLHTQVTKTIHRWLMLIQKIIEGGVESGEFRADVNPKEFASLFISLYEGGVFLTKAKGSTQFANYSFKQMKRMINELKPG